MTREELKERCEKQIEMCEMWAICKGEEPHGKVYEERKLILKLLEQESTLNKIRAEIEKAIWEDTIIILSPDGGVDKIRVPRLDPDEVLAIIDKYKVESNETQQGLAYTDQDTLMPAT